MSDPTLEFDRRLYPVGISTTGKRPDASTNSQVHAHRRVLVWADLDAVEQSLLVVASQERTLDHVCEFWTQRAQGRSEIAITIYSARRLFDDGLIGFYRVGEGYPDLTDAELGSVFEGHTFWDRGHDNARSVGVYLTTTGEDVVLGS